MTDAQTAQINATLERAMALHRDGQWLPASAAYQDILTLAPRHFDALHLSGVAALQRRDYVAAQAWFKRALAINPQYAPAHANLALALQHQSDRELALRSFDRALELAPDLLDALYNRANLLQSMGRLTAAIESYSQALHYQPEWVAARYSRGLAWRDLQHKQNALADFEQVLQLEPGHTDAIDNCGLLMIAFQRPSAALAHFEHVLRLDPGHIHALNNRAVQLQQSGRKEEALTAYEAALAAAPAHGHAAAQVLRLRQELCQWHEQAARSAALCQAIAQGSPLAGGIAPFTALAFSASAAEQQRCARQWAARHLRPNADGATFTHAVRRDPARRLRIGYLSADFHEHATAYLLAGVIEAHQHQAIDCIAYSYGPNDASPMQRRLRSAFTRYEDIRARSDRAAAEKIHADGIDILIDLKGYTGDARSAILSYRAAPLQAQFLGYPGTMGSALVDYLIADHYVIPPEHMAYYDEHIVYLPGCYQPNDPQRLIGPMPTRLEAGLPASGFVFCCFNQSYKITPQVFTQWMRLLQAVPGSVFWLIVKSQTASDNLRREAQARGIDGARLIFAPIQPLSAHLGRLQLADLFLDTALYNAHTTASDALWAGVPVLTCPGQTFASRVAGSLLQSMGLPELIAASPEHYFAFACDLAHNPTQLAALKQKVRAARSNSTLFDAQHFAAKLETAYQTMWQRYQDGLPAAHINLPCASAAHLNQDNPASSFS